MISKNKKLLSKLQLLRSSGQKGFAILIDPDKDNTRYFSALAELLPNYPVDFIFVGGSFVKNGATDYCIEQIKGFTDLPVILFPGNYNQLSARADALFFLSLISGRNPEYLIEQHIKSAPWLKENKLEVIPTSYIIISDSTKASVLKASETKPISPKAEEKIVNTALAGYYLGHQLLYLEAGSGSEEPIPASVIEQVAKTVDLPLICGGGIRNTEAAEEICTAGADVVVIGNALEKNPFLLKSLSHRIKNYKAEHPNFQL
ncbi:MAG: geranylgeranylglyceryl/heptaprenylglyceryl phosphate synthase [Chitinophagales bacterium]